MNEGRVDLLPKKKDLETGFVIVEDPSEYLEEDEFIDLKVDRPEYEHEIGTCRRLFTGVFGSKEIHPIIIMTGITHQAVLKKIDELDKQEYKYPSVKQAAHNAYFTHFAFLDGDGSVTDKQLIDLVSEGILRPGAYQGSNPIRAYLGASRGEERLPNLCAALKRMTSSEMMTQHVDELMREDWVSVEVKNILRPFSSRK